MVGHHQPQHGIPQELQPLVAGKPALPVLVGIGAVGEGIFQQPYILKGIVQLFLQRFHGTPHLMI